MENQPYFQSSNDYTTISIRNGLVVHSTCTEFVFQSLKSEACFDDNDDTVLFSDDEPAGFEIGSQVERIEHFLLSDRLELGKSHSSKLQ